MNVRRNAILFSLVCLFSTGAFAFDCSDYCGSKYDDSESKAACEVGVEAVSELKYLDSAFDKCTKKFGSTPDADICKDNAQSFKLYCM